MACDRPSFETNDLFKVGQSEERASGRASEGVVFLSDEPRKPFVAPSRSLIRSLIYIRGDGDGENNFLFR